MQRDMETFCTTTLSRVDVPPSSESIFMDSPVYYRVTRRYVQHISQTGNVSDLERNLRSLEVPKLSRHSVEISVVSLQEGAY